MRKFKQLVFIFLSFLLFSCQSNYRSRMIRVKSQPQQVSTLDVPQSDRNKSKVAVSVHQSVEENPVQPEVVLLPIEDKIAQKINKEKRIKSMAPRVILVEPRDSVPPIDWQNQYIKDQYRKANTNAWISFVLLVTTILTGIGVFFALWASLKAIRIYRQYMNPGVPEYYGLALFVAILSSVIILAAIALFIVFLFFLF